jgi:hypothetical protein
MAGAVHTNRWTQYGRDMLRVTRPGGWVQMIELSYNIQSDNGTLTEGQWACEPNEFTKPPIDILNRPRLAPMEC